LKRLSPQNRNDEPQTLPLHPNPRPAQANGGEMSLRDQVHLEVRKAEETIKAALQKLHDDTGLIPVEVYFKPIYVSTFEQYGKEKAIMISCVDIRANT
jgi:hypothetical protein